MVKSERLWTTDRRNNLQWSNNDHACRFTLKISFTWGQNADSREPKELPPEHKQNFPDPDQGKILRAVGPESLYHLCDPDWQLAIENPKLHQSQPPSILSSVRRSPNEQWLRENIFFLPYPSPILTRQPLHWNHFLTRPVISSCSPQLSVSSTSKSFALKSTPALQAITT